MDDAASINSDIKSIMNPLALLVEAHVDKTLDSVAECVFRLIDMSSDALQSREFVAAPSRRMSAIYRANADNDRLQQRPFQWLLWMSLSYKAKFQVRAYLLQNFAKHHSNRTPPSASGSRCGHIEHWFDVQTADVVAAHHHGLRHKCGWARPLTWWTTW